MNTTPASSQATLNPSRTAPRRHLFRLGLAASLLSLALTGCGGGTTGDEPTVTLATTATSASAGESVTLIAVASSDLGISAVRFYRVDSGASTLLGTLNATPYQFTTTIPSTATDSVSYFARAVDTDGNTGDSDDVDIAITD
ncbi:Ig-like domain-containing protein [Hydrogenophaga flava]|jgi:hypothetical protein|uniref:Ig-like domain-containing protein n=1 Tax=Hydrogenophaga flava TaxID=65657 RepID=UPI0008242F40|nr:Ig-like domain-containing protein [Hydrogenophaga flava]